MATELDTRIWITQITEAKTVFVDLVRTLSTMEICRNDWHDLTVYRKAPGSKLLKLETFQAKQCEDLLRDYAGDDLRFVAYVSIQCWRFEELRHHSGEITIAVSAWGNKYGKGFQFDLEREGDAQVSITNVGPYCGFNLHEPTEDSERVNTYVEKNIEDFLGLLIDVIERIRPQKLITYTDVGDYVLHNAHLAYYPDIESIAGDAAAYCRMIRKARLGNSGTPENLWLHNWRNEELKQELRLKIENLPGSSCDITASMVAETLNRKVVDVLQLSEGYILLNMPFPVNNFLDDFLFELLDELS